MRLGVAQGLRAGLAVWIVGHLTAGFAPAQARSPADADAPDTPVAEPEAVPAGGAEGRVVGRRDVPAPEAEADLEAVEDLPAAPAAELGLGQVLGTLADRHPTLLAARAARDGAEGALLGAEGAFDTKLAVQGKAIPLGQYSWHHVEAELSQPTRLWGTTFFGGWRRSGGDLPLYYGGLATVEGGEAVLGLRVPVWQGGAIDEPRAQISQRRLKLGQAARKVTAAHLKLRLKATEAYWKWVYSGHRRRIAAHVLTIAERRVVQLEARVASGDGPEIDLVENQRLILARRVDLTKAIRAQEAAAFALSLFVRDAEGNPRVPALEAVPIHLPEPPAPTAYVLADDLDHALAHRPELMALQQGADAAAVALALAENQTSPQLDLSLAGVQPFGSDQGGLERTELEAGLKFSVPLQRRKAEGAAAKAQAERSQIAQALRMARDEVRAEVADARSATHAAHLRVEVARQELVVARRLEAAETQRLEAGDSTLLVLNLREVATADAARSLAEALTDQHLAHAAWLAATARGLEGLADEGAADPEGEAAPGAQ